MKRMRVHDLVLGALAGVAAGLVLGVFGSARLAEGPWLPLAGVVAGAAAGVAWLGRLDSERDRVLTVRVVAAWLVLAAAVTFLVGLGIAISRFQ